MLFHSDKGNGECLIVADSLQSAQSKLQAHLVENMGVHKISYLKQRELDSGVIFWENPNVEKHELGGDKELNFFECVQGEFEEEKAENKAPVEILKNAIPDTNTSSSARLGPMGKFPYGKLNEQDNGALALSLCTQGEAVVLNFGSRVAWIGILPDEARRLSALLLQHASSIDGK
jgi:hypothetical protein